MEPTTTTTRPPPPPAAASAWSPKASANKRQRKAALPLGDVTNLLPNTPKNPSTRRPLPLPSDTSASSSASVTPVSKGSSDAVSEEHSLVRSAISTVYTRRKTTKRTSNPITNNKAPFPARTASCPLLEKLQGPAIIQQEKPQWFRILSLFPPRFLVIKLERPFRRYYMDEDYENSSANKRHMRKGDLSSGKPKLPEDFVKKQRAYFEEIDAFELPEEAVSETDLE